ncbi:hypothetical protein N7478_008088 [Penicillium angulare]|uniref:uncharacterized protein n=1 Tax=Penicillium angulare TaxID=116970 RepID=UPI0025403C94|nr:uncharacterized protein N7478_008088 [Penicillium angulare]KAJ5272963.1 hypothetical protein N7478_008088 [Penicillium angulare]
MPLFKKSKASANPSSGRFPLRSVEQLAHPALAPPDHNSSSIENYVDRHPSDPRLAYHEGPGSNPQSQPPTEPRQSSLTRAQSQRQHQLQQPSQPQQRDRVAAPEDPQPRRRTGRTGLFVRPSSGILDRRPSISKGKQQAAPATAHPASQPTSPQQLKSFAEQQQQRSTQNQNLYPDDQSPTGAQPSYEPRSASLAYQHQHLQHSQRSLHQSHPSIGSDIQDWSPSQQSTKPQQQQQQPTLQLPRPAGLERSNTDPTLVQRTSARPSPTDRAPESPRYAAEQQGDRGSTQSRSEHDLVLHNSRPPSRQTYEPHSPSRQQIHPDAMQQVSAQAPSQAQQANDRPSSRRGSASQPSTMPTEQARSTPSGSRTRDELENIDVRALIQKHDELQSKYSKVKRYYFEKEAQVQHLQNTVAHQRMAVSRTVLDDNEYANRFQRLDGAIKDLAFSTRKDWRAIPPWLHGLTTDDAVTTGTKEMMALGRAVISRWLVEEVFQKHFHPGLEPGLSIQLKKIEMNLRRQQMRPVTDEDRENAIAKLSNWRRTTFDGLGEILANPTAQDRRSDLIEHLTILLATFLSTQLQEQALPGLEAGVRMIIENTINIIEKIPLEARDVCVEYFPPNITFHENYMKVEGQLPPLTHQPPPPTDQDLDDEGESSPGSNSTGGAGGDGPSPAPREPRRRSVFGALMGRRPATEQPARAASGGKPEIPETPRIRFASFLTVEVRGKGPATVLVQAPVWLIE